jgi:hypothetical protein
MANLTKKMRDRQEEVKRMIMDGHRRGVCDTYGRTIKTEQGRPVAQPRFKYRGSVIKTWRYSPELGKCVRVQ